MADSPGRVLLVKFRGDLRSLQGTMDDVIRAVASMQRQLKTMQDKSHKSSEDNTAKALAGEKLKQAAVLTTTKTGEKKQTQESSLQAAITKTLALRKQETLEISRQLSLYKELASSQSKASRNISAQLAQEVQGRRANQPAQGVIPVAMRTVSSTANTVGSLAQAAEAASYQQQLMRTMRLQEAKNAPVAASAPNPLAAGLAGGLATAQMSEAENAAMERERMRTLRQASTTTMTAIPTTAPMSKEQQREQKRQQAEDERNKKKQAADAERTHKKQSGDSARQQVMNADAQVRLIQNAEKQKQTLVLASNAAQREEVLAQLRAEEIDYSAYVSRIKVLIEQEKNTKLEAINAEEKALQHLLEVELSTSKITQQTYQNESLALGGKMNVRRTAVEAGGMRQEVALARQRPAEPKEPRGEGGKENDAGEIFRGLGSGISKGLGGGLIGSVATGLLFGGGTLMVFDQAARGIESMIEKIKELVLETGPIQQLEAQFEHLSRAAGVDGPEFMGKLQTATHGLVGNMQLLQYATGALRSNLHLTDAQTIKFASDVSELARIQGKSVPEALAMAQRGLTTGQTRGVATYLGINQRELGLNAAPRYSTIQEREQLQQRQVQGAIENQISKSGPAPETMTEQIQRLQVAKKNFGEDFGQGLATSEGIKSFVTTLSRMADGITNLSEVARKMGSALGDVFGTLGKMAEDVAKVFNNLHETLGSGEKNAWLSSVYENLTSIKGILFDIYVTWQGLILGAKNLASIWEYMKGQPSASNTMSAMKAGASAFAEKYSPTGEIVSPAIAGAKAAWEAGKPKPEQPQLNLGNMIESNKAESDTAVDEMKEMLSGGRLAGMQDRAQKLRAELTKLAPRPPTRGAGPETADVVVKRGQLAALEAQIAKLQKSDEGTGTSKTTPVMDPAARALAIQMKEAEVKLTEDTEKEKLTIVEDSLDKQRDAQKIMLRDGETDMASYVSKMKGFVEQDKNAQLSKIDVLTQAQLGLLETERRTGQIPQELYVAKAADVTKGSADQRAAVTREADKQTAALNDQLAQDKLAATKTNLNTELDIRKDALALQRSTIQHAYDEQLVDVKTYLDSERDAIEKTYDIEMQAAADKYKFNQSLAGEAEKHAEEVRAGSQRNLSLQQLNQKAPSLQLKYNTQQAQDVQDYIDQQQQLAVAQRGGAPLPIETQRADLSTKMTASTAEIRAQEELLQQLENSGQKYTSDWYATSTAISAATEKLIAMRQEMQQLTNNSDKLLSGFSNIAVGLGSFPQGRTRALSGVQAIPALLQSFTSAQQQTGATANPVGNVDVDTSGTGAWMDTNNPGGVGAGATVTPGGPQSAIFGGFASVGTFLTSIFKNIQGLPDAFKNLGQSLTPILGALGGAAQGIASGNAVQGAAGGGALGGDVGMGIGKMFTSVANIAGPIGSIAGAAFGGILSSIIGQKQQKAADMIHTMSLQFDQVMTTFKEGVVGMNQAIQESEQIRNDLQTQMQSAGKKKRQQYQQALDAMNQQIIALQAQQYAMLVQMQEALPTVGATPLTDFISQLQQIVQQYTQFAGAATNATQLAQANQYLTQSLQGYAQTQLTSMTQAEQGAIQDAINLNDLYQQRQLLLQQMADQERDIMTQGILTRQTTTAQSKMEQIAVMKQQNELQLENMNEEISAATFRVNAEKQIFNLATTRIGLETQLLQMQNQGTLLDMARIAALQQVVMALQSGNFQSNLTNGLNLNNNNPGQQAFQNLLAALGIYSNDQPVGNQPSLTLEQMFLNLFNQNSAYGFGGFSSVNGGS